MSISSKSKSLLKLIGPFLFIILLIRVIDPREAASYLKELAPKSALISILFFPVIMYTMTLRWWIICRRINLKAPLNNLFKINYVSWFISNIPISGITFILKIVYLKEEEFPVGRSFISVTLEKLFDVIGLLVFGLYPLFYFPNNIMNSKMLAIILGLASLGLCVGILFRNKIIEVIAKVLRNRLIKQGQDATDNFKSDLKKYWSKFDVRTFFIIIALSICIGFLNSLVLYTLARALEIQISFGLAIGCAALISIANIFPVTLNGLGTRDAVLVLTFSLMGYPGEAAIALGCVAFFWVVLFKFSGVFFWLRRPLPYKTLFSIKEKYF